MKTLIVYLTCFAAALFGTERAPKEKVRPHKITHSYFVADENGHEDPAYVKVLEHSVVITAKDGTWSLELPRAGHVPIAPALLEKMEKQRWPTEENGDIERLRLFITKATQREE